MDQILKWSEGNPGAIVFLSTVYLDPNADLKNAIAIDSKLNKCKTIRGTNLHVLYSDLCDKDISKVVKLCKNCPDDVLEDACNRQDYSGIGLVKSYFEKSN